MSALDKSVPSEPSDADGRPAPFPSALCVPAEPVYLERIAEIVHHFAEQAGLDKESRNHLDVVVDEACTNVMRHSFPEGETGELRVAFELLDDGVAVTVMDKGTPFSLDDGIEASKRSKERDPATGGMGWFLIRKLADEVRYEWDEANGNQLTIIKRRKKF